MRPGPRTLAALGAAVLLVALAVVVLGGGDDRDDAPPAAEATRLVPADALVYLHLSTDTGREGTKEAEALARRFPGFERIRSDLITRLTAPSCGVRASDLRGDEAALALLDTGSGTTAGSLVILDTGRDRRDNERDRTCGAVQTARIGRFLVVGQPQTLQIARNLARGKGRTLADAQRYRRLTGQLPRARVLDGWVSQDGVRRLLQPQGGLLGGAGTLLDQPGLVGAAVGLTAAKDGARLTVRTALDPRRKRTTTFRPFAPRRQEDVPDGALAYLGVSGLSSGLQRVLSVAGAGSGAAFAGLGPLLERAREQLGKQVGASLQKDLLDLFRGEVGLSLTPGLPAPTLTITVAVRDEDATARTLRALERPLAKILAPSGGTTPTWTRAGGIASLRLAAGIELHYALDEGRLIVATRRSGVQAVQRGGEPLTATEPWRRTLGTAPTSVSSLLFLDLSQLLRLAEQTGLNDSSAYRSVRADLGKVRAVGARSTADADETTAEILLSIP
jgi:hypothetical protein